MARCNIKAASGNVPWPTTEQAALGRLLSKPITDQASKEERLHAVEGLAIEGPAIEGPAKRSGRAL